MKLLSEPLLHFMVGGTLLFGISTALSGHREQAIQDPVSIGAGEVRWLGETFASQWRRNPTPDELLDQLATLLEEELLAREARALRLDQGDTIVRRRLAQKLAFMVEETTRFAEPDEDVLRQFFALNSGKYQAEPKVSFTQIFFRPDHNPDADIEARAVLSRMSQADAGPPTLQGDSTLLDPQYKLMEMTQVASLFGTDFARIAFSLPANVWHGPVQSAFGVHLLRMDEKIEAPQRSFEDVRSSVEQDWRRERGKEIRAEYISKLREKYGASIDDDARRLLGQFADKASAP